jgi:hypothetical protein
MWVIMMFLLSLADLNQVTTDEGNGLDPHGKP